MTGLTFPEALDRITMVNRLFYKVLDQNTLIIVPESRQKRLAYDELVMRTFYLQNAEIKETVTLIKTLAKVTTVMDNASLGAITIVGTIEQVAMAERIIEANDKARGEVLVEVQILEVNRVAAKQWGLDLSNYSASSTLSPTGAANEVANGLLSIRPQFLSSLNQADWIVSLPATLFARFIQNESTTRIIASPRLRAAEGKKAELKIGQEVPVPMTTYNVGVGSVGNTGSYFPATSFNYRNVGVNLELTPGVSASGDIRLELKAEFSLLGADRNVGTAGNPLLVPTFLTRSVVAVLRLRDGETGLIGGLLQGTEANSFAGALGTNSIPILGKLFGDRKKSRDETEVLISITPRIVRGPKVTEEDLIPLRVGTEEVRRVEGARPGLFGTEPPSTATGTTAAAPGTPAPTRGAPAPAAGTTPTLPVVPPPVSTPNLTGASGAESANVAGGAPPTASVAAATPSAADTRPTSAILSPPEVALRVGQSAGLAVLLVGARDVLWIEMTLVYDPALVQVTDVAPGALLTLDGTPIQAEPQLEPGRSRVRFTRATGASGSGAVAAVTLRGLKAGSGTLGVDSLVIGRTSGTERPAAPAPARVVVAP
jgi:general secretion pathway protein D